MGCSLALHLEEKIPENEYKPLGWFKRNFIGLTRLFYRILGHEHHTLGTFEALGMPVGQYQKLSDGSLLFELFLFDLEIDKKAIPSSIGHRITCNVLHCVSDDERDLISPNDELDVVGSVLWMTELGGYVFVATGIQSFSK